MTPSHAELVELVTEWRTVEYTEDNDVRDCADELEALLSRSPAREQGAVAIVPTHEAADAFWAYWRENGETHKHGYYESTWGAINEALRVGGVVPHPAPSPDAHADDCGCFDCCHGRLMGDCTAHKGEDEARVVNPNTLPDGRRVFASAEGTGDTPSTKREGG